MTDEPTAHEEFQALNPGLDEQSEGYAELFDLWVEEKLAEQATCDIEADRLMGRRR